MYELLEPISEVYWKCLVVWPGSNIM